MKYILILVIFFVILTQPALAWGECPFGEINDPAPGLCGRYLDTDGDNICDYSQPAPGDRTSADSIITESSNQPLPHISGKELKTKTVAEVAEFFTIDRSAYQQALSSYLNANVSTSDSLQDLLDKYRLPTSEAREIANNIFLSSVETSSNAGVTNSSTAATILNRYKFFSIIFIITVLYLLTYSLSIYKVISLVAHRKLWNVLLLLSFLVSALLGVLLVIRINYGWTPSWPFNMLYWHVEAGVVMATISVFHILWHLQYFRYLVRRKK